MTNDEKLIQGLKLVIEAFSEMVNNKDSQDKVENKDNSVTKPRRVMNISEAAEYSGLSKYQVYSLMRQKKLKHFRVGCKYLVNSDAIDEYIMNAQLESVKKEEEINEYGKLRKVKA